MSGCIVQVWFEADSKERDRKPNFNMIETEFEDFASFCEAVDENRMIGGAILWTRKTEDNAQRIVERQPFAFRGVAVMRCALPRWTFRDDQVGGRADE